MSPQPYLIVSGAIFSMVAMVHLVRVLQGWTVHIGPWNAPLWVSWLGIAVTTVLAIWAFTLASAENPTDKL